MALLTFIQRSKLGCYVLHRVRDILARRYVYDAVMRDAEPGIARELLQHPDRIRHRERVAILRLCAAVSCDSEVHHNGYLVQINFL